MGQNLSLQFKEGKLSKTEFREAVMQLQENFENIPSAFKGEILGKVIPVKHSFCNGMYVRECFIPKGMIVIGKIHKKEHPVFLLRGRAKVITESGGVEELVAPYYGISPAATKRVVVSLEDTLWVTTHVTDKTTPEEVEAEVIAESYEDIEGEL